jgi:polyisoprenoid-binding protein YceI
MKNWLFFALIFILAACSDAPEGDKALITDQQKASETTGNLYTVDRAASVIKFTGHGVGKNHSGQFRLDSGSVSVLNNQISSGNFVINMRSMELDQKGGMFDSKLKPHLQGPDFFDMEKFGAARFEITKVEPYKNEGKDTSLVDGANYAVSGNFTLKDVTKNITFPAKIDLDDNRLKAKAKFNIDRTQWKMNYGNDKTLKDGFISETVNIELDLEAVKQ